MNLRILSSQTDPNGNTTLWAYDDLGRVAKHSLPLGQFETFKYDPNGNVIEKTDFNGDTAIYEYTACCNRLERKIFADGAEVAYTYTPTGRRETVTDSRGVTRYDYNLRDRLEKVTHPNGTELSCTYDDAGNRLTSTKDRVVDGECSLPIDPRKNWHYKIARPVD